MVDVVTLVQSLTERFVLSFLEILTQSFNEVPDSITQIVFQILRDPIGAVFTELIAYPSRDVMPQTG